LYSSSAARRRELTRVRVIWQLLPGFKSLRIFCRVIAGNTGIQILIQNPSMPVPPPCRIAGSTGKSGREETHTPRGHSHTSFLPFLPLLPVSYSYQYYYYYQYYIHKIWIKYPPSLLEQLATWVTRGLLKRKSLCVAVLHLLSALWRWVVSP
jgi:hypothetical protein